MKPRSADDFINGAGKPSIKTVEKNSSLKTRYNMHILKESKRKVKELVRHFETTENADLSAGEIMDRIIGAEYERVLGDEKDD